MSSSSPRNRLNQFYTTKKRKAISPVTKLGRIEKGAKIVADGSPSAKGSLENYLVPSQGENDEDPVRPDLVRRKLGLDIGSSVDNGLDKQPVSLAREVQRSYATRAGIENEVPVVDDSVQEKNLGDFEHGEKSELKQFKAELFSLYCGFMLLKVDQMFEAEALGLGAMYETETIRVPKLYKVHDEYRTDYDPGRGGYGKLVQKELEVQRHLVDYGTGSLGSFPPVIPSSYSRHGGGHGHGGGYGHGGSRRHGRDYPRKRYRDDDRHHTHEPSKRASDHESRRNSDHESRPEKNPRFRESGDSDDDEEDDRKRRG